MADSEAKRPIGFVPLGVFFFFGAAMALLAAFTLAVPGTLLDEAWKLNREGHEALSSFGRIMGLPFLLLSAALLCAGTGWFMRRKWGWGLGTTLIAIISRAICSILSSGMKFCKERWEWSLRDCF